MHEKNLEWQDKLLISNEQKHLEDWYLEINPNGVVPTLIVDKQKPIFESSAIMEYLEDEYPETSLRPKSNNAIAQMRAWIALVDHLTTPAVRYPSFQYGGLLLKFKSLSKDEFLSKIEKRPLKSEFYREMDQDIGFTEEKIQTALKAIRKTVERLEYLLEESKGPWIMGEVFTLCDIVVGPLLDRIEDLGLEYIWTSKYPLVSLWLKSFQDRPSVKKAFYSGSRLSEMFPELNLGTGVRKDTVEHYLNGT